MAGPAPRRNLARLRNPRAEYYAWKMEETQRIIDELRTQSEAGVPIIVEGRRDEAALRRLGVMGKVHCLKARGESRHEFLDRLDGTKEAIVLTDFDREGKELETWLYKELSQRGVKSDLKIWIRMRSLARTEVRSVEELPSFIRALESKARGIRPVIPQVPRT
ncbi:toprim domain-containing protein [Candidatus Bathyarchaeota archaeon]|nr:MAG: toprim domain-containing protein [Candidatus Bathyarchaeota archaeon]